MTSLRNGVADYVLREGVSSGAPAPAFERDEGRRYSAMDLPCSECQSPAGERCPGNRVCAARMEAAVAMVRDGKLDSHGPALVLSECQDCRRQKNPGGRWFACANTSHQCRKRRGDGKQCQYAVLPGTYHCPAHTAQQPGTRPGRRPVLTDAQVADAMRRHDADGETWARIAESLNVSVANLALRVKKLRERQQAAA